MSQSSGRRLRVAFLDHTAAASGAELALLNVLEHLDVDRHVVLGADGAVLPRFAALGGLTLLPLTSGLEGATRDGAGPLAAAHTVQYATRLARVLRDVQPDVVYANSLRAGLYGGLAARMIRRPLVWHVRDRISADYLGERQADGVARAIRALSRRVVANSQTTAATLLPGPPVTVIPSPLSRPPTASGPGRAGPLTYVCASRLAPWKGQDVFLRAFADAFPGGEQRAVIVGAAQFGEDDYAAGLRALVADLGITARVDFRGHCDDVMRELAGADVLVHSPTLPEPFGSVVVEGLAAGLVVVARGDGGPAEILSHDVDGLLYAPGHPDELVRLLRRVDTDGGLRARLQVQGRRRAAAFSAPDIAARVEAVCRSAAGA